MELNEYTFSEISKEYHRRVKERNINKSKPLTCRDCQSRISATRLNTLYHDRKLFNNINNSFQLGQYCTFGVEFLPYNKMHLVPLFKGLSHLACKNYKQNK